MITLQLRTSRYQWPFPPEPEDVFWAEEAGYGHICRLTDLRQLALAHGKPYFTWGKALASDVYVTSSGNPTICRWIPNVQEFRIWYAFHWQTVTQYKRLVAGFSPPYAILLHSDRVL